MNGVTVVLQNSCDGSYTYELHGKEALAIGRGDKHDTKYDSYKKDGAITVKTLNDGTETGIHFNQEGCFYTFDVYPTKELYRSYVTKDPIIITFAVGMVFVFSIVLFLIYDRLVERRQGLILAKATQSTAIVSSLFPKNVRDRLLEVETGKDKNANVNIGANHRLKTFLNGNAVGTENGTQPIADLFPHCTVFFGDIAGFTAWSSTREPAQVFVLLQAVYQAFDLLAKRRNVFKVETIGDSYVAVTGLVRSCFCSILVWLSE